MRYRGWTRDASGTYFSDDGKYLIQHTHVMVECQKPHGRTGTGGRGYMCPGHKFHVEDVWKRYTVTEVSTGPTLKSLIDEMEASNA